MNFSTMFSAVLPLMLVIGTLNLAMDLPQSSRPLGFRGSNPSWEMDRSLHWVDEEAGIRSSSRHMASSEKVTGHELSRVDQEQSSQPVVIVLHGQPAEQSTHSPSNLETHSQPLGLDMHCVPQEVSSLEKSNSIPPSSSRIVDCAICLDAMEDDEPLRVLASCQHKYHQLCIEAWLKEHDTCPMCRVADPVSSATLNQQSRNPRTPLPAPRSRRDIILTRLEITIFVAIIILFMTWFFVAVQQSDAAQLRAHSPPRYL
ncbi:uncharacterized protein PGTG_00650 [Puccinia graminis f. sp. tritici CRL 75-36-700-3]|uniref:RING-type domain-containing protein n=1 Tax=Puccinia graminis f. sp. tritici (strain CRL 75-36-700-3 / race SCCL) TaxID=418459 RepID=E3JQP5_PUCGT|nr:uncharacterized protein PGTG_00650 [Puccinia graminis f. sp. tritici CRL 75-36-700-3]EFP74694.2 hypothetical protein PGTG_00650 [Puccinia graminis f. sp. tritici CRL 75-36-700-3]